MCPFVSRAVVVERWVRFCRSPRWSFRTLIYVALRLAGEPGHTAGTPARAPRGAAAAAGRPPPGARHARHDRAVTRTRSRHAHGTVDSFPFGSCLIGHIGLALRWACGPARGGDSAELSRHVGGAFVCADAAGPRATSCPCACRARGRCEGRRLWLSSGWLRRIAMRVAGTLSRRSVEGSKLTQ